MLSSRYTLNAPGGAVCVKFWCELLAFSPLTPIGIVTLHRRLEGAPCKKSAGERIFVIPRANPYIYPQIFFCAARCPENYRFSALAMSFDGIGFITGGFDPIHGNHLKVAIHAAVRLRMKRVYFVCSHSDPQKPLITPRSLREELLWSVIEFLFGSAPLDSRSAALFDSEMDLTVQRALCKACISVRHMATHATKKRIASMLLAEHGISIVYQLVGSDKFFDEGFRRSLVTESKKSGFNREYVVYPRTGYSDPTMFVEESSKVRLLDARGPFGKIVTDFADFVDGCSSTSIRSEIQHCVDMSDLSSRFVPPQLQSIYSSAGLHYVAPPNARLCINICVVGAPLSGKSTLALKLQAALHRSSYVSGGEIQRLLSEQLKTTFHCAKIFKTNDERNSFVDEAKMELTRTIFGREYYTNSQLKPLMANLCIFDAQTVSDVVYLENKVLPCQHTRFHGLNEEKTPISFDFVLQTAATVNELRQRARKRKRVNLAGRDDQCRISAFCNRVTELDCASRVSERTPLNGYKLRRPNTVVLHARDVPDNVALKLATLTWERRHLRLGMASPLRSTLDCSENNLHAAFSALRRTWDSHFNWSLDLQPVRSAPPTA